MGTSEVCFTLLTVALGWLSVTVSSNTLTISWEIIEPKTLRVEQVSVGPSGVWAIAQNGSAYYKDNTYDNDGTRGGDWILVSEDPKLKRIDVGTDIVWAVSPSGFIYWRTGMDKANPTGCSWRLVPGGLIDISVSPKGHVWGVAFKDRTGGQGVRRAGITESNREGTHWQKLFDGETTLSHISVGDVGVWAVCSNHTAMYREGTYYDPNNRGTGWLPLNETFTAVSAGHDEVWGIQGQYLAYREGLAKEVPSGIKWTLHYKTLKQIDVYAGAAWGSDSFDPPSVYARLV